MKKKLLFFLLSAVIMLSEQRVSILAESVTDEREIESIGTVFPANPVHHCTGETGGSDYTDWDYVYFGSYPQTEVTGDLLIREIIEADYDANGDAWINGIKYRRISISDTRYDGYFGDSKYRYFKWQRIKWRVLQNTGNALFVIPDIVLDCKNYHDSSDAVTWGNCTLRTWLNGTFYNTAFSNNEQEEIMRQIVVNDDNTQDKVYLLSMDEVTTPKYGFCEKYDTDSVSRWMQPSDYAHAMGAYVYSNINTCENANCIWWLRFPIYDSNTVACVLSFGSLTYYGGYDVTTPYMAVVPALHFSLTSDLWTTTDDGTSGAGGENVSEDKGDNGLSKFQIIPKGTSIKGKLKSKSKAFTIKWKKSASVTGYKIQYSTGKKFTKKTTKTKTVKKVSKTTLTVKKLKSNKRYYVRICTYRTVNGKTYYSDWSKVKSVRTKR